MARTRMTAPVALAASVLLFAACSGGTGPSDVPPVEVDTETVRTMADVEQHDNRDDCWTAIDGKVYDMTGYIRQHPGGANRIMDVCGIDASHAFDFQHGDNARAQEELAKFQIGVLG